MEFHDFVLDINALRIRNSQSVSGGTAPTDLQTEKFQGDGVQRTFGVGYPLIKKPLLYLGEPPIQIDESLIGIRGVDDKNNSIKWLYEIGSKDVTQKSIDPIITDVLTVEYYGSFPISVEVKDSERITDRKNRVGGTGIIEAEDAGEEFDNFETATTLAEERLSKNAEPNEKIELVITEMDLMNSQYVSFSDFDVGKNLVFNYPARRLSGSFLITEMIIVYGGQSGADTLNKAKIIAHKGDPTKGYGSVLASVEKTVKGLTINENEVITIVELSAEGIVLSEEFLVFRDYNLYSQDSSPIIERAYGFLQDIDGIYVRS
jgi:hypothetical protein